MSVEFTRRDFAIRLAGFGLAVGLAPATALAQRRASRPAPSPVIAEPDSAVDPELVSPLTNESTAEKVKEFKQMAGLHFR